MPIPIKSYSELLLLPNFMHSATNFERQSSKTWVASFKLDQDVSDLFPYINGALDEAIYYEQPLHVRFLFVGYRCLLYPGLTVAYFFESKLKVEQFVDHLIAFLNDLESQKSAITPNHDRVKRIPVMDILKLLPKTNCRECGYLTCMAFAAALMQGRTLSDKCPSLAMHISENAIYPIYDDQGRTVNTLSLRTGTASLKYIIQEQQHKIVTLETALSSKKRNEPQEPPVEPSFNDGHGLTGREIEVLKLIAEGYSNNEIAGLLFISAHTVKSHMINIFNKLDVNDRTKAAVVAIRRRII